MSSTRIAIVEDDPRVQKALTRAIESSGRMQVVLCTGSVVQARHWMQDHPEPDAVQVWLVDLGLTDGSGLSVIHEARQHHPGSEIMVVSAFGDEAKVLDSIAAGASGYLLKGQGDDDLVEHIDDLVQGGSPMSPIIARQVLNRMKASRSFQQAQQTREADALTDRESTVLNLIARGYRYDEVGVEMALSTNTVRHHIKNIYSKLSVHSKGAAIFEANRRGWIKPA
jgi:DNA-binding NarL/FixJ family response regulator